VRAKNAHKTLGDDGYNDDVTKKVLSHIDKSGHGAGGIIGVQCGKHKMAGKR